MDHCVVGSYERFRAFELAYRFPRPEAFYPASAPLSFEDPNRNTALVICVDGSLPPPVRKHFRLRSSNRATWRNIRRLLPDADLSEYRATDHRLESEGARHLLTQLLPLDYALLVERPLDESGAPQASELTHLHVKVERITDNAIRDLARSLGYIQRNLFERGEDYVEALEAKFFEYYGFPPHAAGRKAAAAMAAQLLRQHDTRFSVYVASQESGRLTVLDETEMVTQYILVEGDERLHGCLGDCDPAGYVVPASRSFAAAAVLRLRFERTMAASPNSRRQRDRDLMSPWLHLSAQDLMPLRDGVGDPLPFAWATID